MEWLDQAPWMQAIAWFLFSTLAAVASSWLVYHFVGRAELLEKKRLKEASEKQERLRRETIRWANPILAAVNSLESRLGNVLESAGYLALTQDYESRINPNWSISYDYFMNSTLFLFGQYFAWIQMFEEELSFELFESQEEKNQLFDAVARVRSALGSFPPGYVCSGQDTQVFGLQQRAIGETLIVHEGTQRRCLTYPEFIQEIETRQLQAYFEPLVHLLEDLSPRADCRWKRLKATRQALSNLKVQCRSLLDLPSTHDPHST